jgi:hypothetical protein
MNCGKLQNIGNDKTIANLSSGSRRHTSSPIISSSLLLDPHQLPHFTPKACRWFIEGSLVRIYNWRIPRNIHLKRRNNLGALDQLPRHIQDRGKDEHSVIDEEVLDTPRFEGGIAICEDNEHHPAQANPATILFQDRQSVLSSNEGLKNLQVGTSQCMAMSFYQSLALL